MFGFIFRLLRAALIAALGAALAAKLLLESNALPDTEEIDLISIFEGSTLVSSARPFYGGKVMAAFGGVLLDLREATPAPTGIHVDVAILAGGVNLVVPEGWRATYRGRTIMGGWMDETRTTADEDAPRITITGYVVLGGLQVTTKSPTESKRENAV